MHDGILSIHGLLEALALKAFIECGRCHFANNAATPASKKLVCCLARLQVYESCEALFCALADETQKYTDWLALGDTGEDLEELVEQQLWGRSATRAADGDDLDSSTGGGDVASGQEDDKGVAAWELNMKALKTAAYDLGRLPTEVSCDSSSSSSSSRSRSRSSLRQCQDLSYKVSFFLVDAEHTSSSSADAHVETDACCSLTCPPPSRLPCSTAQMSAQLTCELCCLFFGVQVRIDVCCVRLNAFKAYVEEMIKRLREALGASLRKRVRTHLTVHVLAACVLLQMILPSAAAVPYHCVHTSFQCHMCYLVCI
jgi:hypothetical protein